MKLLGILLNIVLPGVGTLIVGKVVQGIIQLVLAIFAIALCFTVFGAIIGIPIYLIVWIWAIVSAATVVDRNQRNR